MGTREAADQMAGAALALIELLEPAQISDLVWPFPSDPERTSWFYTPTDHGGIELRDLTSPQQHAVMRLLGTGLSEAGYNTAVTIMGTEAVLERMEGARLVHGKRRRDPGAYAVRIFGDPAGGEPWSWRLGGHHVSLHYTIANGEVAATTPSFFGLYPARSPLLGPHWLRPLAAVEDLARDLMHLFDPTQRCAAILSVAPPSDVVGSNRPYVAAGDEPLSFRTTFRPSDLDDAMIARFDAMQAAWNHELGLEAQHIQALRLPERPVGAPIASFTEPQREVFDALLDTYLGRMPDELANAERARVHGLGGLCFAWAGSTEPRRPHYYRIQGPRLLVEYDCTQNEANHTHTVWRDPANDFGRDTLAAHRLDHH
jgi:Protein of unknown function (DUF3500)